MKSSILILTVFVFLTGPSLMAMAATQKKVKKSATENVEVPEVKTYIEEEDQQTSPRWQLQAAGSIYQFDYKEDVAPPKKSSESGTIAGAHIEGDFRLQQSDDSLVLRGLLDIASSDTRYDGSTQGDRTTPPAPLVSKTNNQFMNFETDLMLNIATIVPQKSYLKGYTGLGARTWTRDLQGNGGYKEDYSWFYLPLGLVYQTQFGGIVNFGLEGTLKFMFGGRMVAHLSALNSNLNDLDVDLGSKPGYKFQMPVGLIISRNWQIVATPFYEVSEIGESNAKFMGYDKDGNSLYGLEPNSKTIQYGTNIGVQGSF